MLEASPENFAFLVGLCVFCVLFVFCVFAQNNSSKRTFRAKTRKERKDAVGTDSSGASFFTKRHRLGIPVIRPVVEVAPIRQQSRTRRSEAEHRVLDD